MASLRRVLHRREIRGVGIATRSESVATSVAACHFHCHRNRRLRANERDRPRTTMRHEEKCKRPSGAAIQSECWRRGSESNRRRRLCRPLHDHSATPPRVRRDLCSACAGRAISALNQKGEPACALPSRIWSGKRVSNSRPQPWQGCALPTELFPLGTVGNCNAYRRDVKMRCRPRYAHTFAIASAT